MRKKGPEREIKFRASDEYEIACMILLVSYNDELHTTWIFHTTSCIEYILQKVTELQSSLILNIYAVQKRNFSSTGSLPTKDVQSIHRMYTLNECIYGIKNTDSGFVADHLFIKQR
jgi:hypothetical protein